MKLDTQKFSGGSYDYMCDKFKWTYDDKMFDSEMNYFIYDFVKVLHDLEWWQSDDIDEEDYRKTLSEFKSKWFGKARGDNLQKIVTKECDKLKNELLKMIGERND